MESIGAILKTQRESRGISVEDAHESTKITVQNISALETDRFDSFPNKVYARAFLRDYANFLGLDSIELLSRYEEQWSPQPGPEPVAVRKQGSPWRVLGYTLLILVVASAIGAGSYFGWKEYQRQHKLKVQPRVHDTQTKPGVATVPKAPELAPPTDEKPGKPATAVKPPVVPPVPQTQTLEVTALQEVWIRLVVDGTTSYIGIMPKGQTKTVQGKTIAIRAGKAGAIQLKLNGQVQPPLGSLGEPKTKVFVMPKPAPPAITPGTAPAPPATDAAPARPTGP